MSTSAPSALQRLLQTEDHDLLVLLLSALPPHIVCVLSQTSHAWARAAEVGLKVACDRFHWQQPRRPRLQRSSGSLGAALPWRACFIARACRACLASPGDFAVRGIDGGAPRFFLCSRCAKNSSTVARLQRERATLDVTGLSGKPLYTRAQSKFCSEVSKLSKESIDNASGRRADVVRHGQGGSRR